MVREGPPAVREGRRAEPAIPTPASPKEGGAQGLKPQNVGSPRVHSACDGHKLSTVRSEVGYVFKKCLNRTTLKLPEESIFCIPILPHREWLVSLCSLKSLCFCIYS